MIFKEKASITPHITSHILSGTRGKKNLPATAGDVMRSSFDSWGGKEGMATHSTILAWRVPWIGEPGWNSPWGHKE